MHVRIKSISLPRIKWKRYALAARVDYVDLPHLHYRVFDEDINSMAFSTGGQRSYLEYHALSHATCPQSEGRCRHRSSNGIIRDSGTAHNGPFPAT